MAGLVKARTLAFALCVAWAFPIVRPLEAQQPQPPPPAKPELPAPPSPPQLPEHLSPYAEIWRSQTTGHAYRVRIEGQTFSAVWVNIPPELAQHNAYIRTECEHVGSKWIGMSRSFLPCVVEEGKNKHLANWCPLVTRTEITSITPERIAGRGQTLKRFDCAHCRLLETAWADFVWVPEKTKTKSSRR